MQAFRAAYQLAAEQNDRIHHAVCKCCNPQGFKPRLACGRDELRATVQRIHIFNNDRAVLENLPCIRHQRRYLPNRVDAAILRIGLPRECFVPPNFVMQATFNSCDDDLATVWRGRAIIQFYFQS